MQRCAIALTAAHLALSSTLWAPLHEISQDYLGVSSPEFDKSPAALYVAGVTTFEKNALNVACMSGYSLMTKLSPQPAFLKRISLNDCQPGNAPVFGSGFRTSYVAAFEQPVVPAKSVLEPAAGAVSEIIHYVHSSPSYGKSAAHVVHNLECEAFAATAVKAFGTEHLVSADCGEVEDWGEHTYALRSRARIVHTHPSPLYTTTYTVSSDPLPHFHSAYRSLSRRIKSLRGELVMSFPTFVASGPYEQASTNHTDGELLVLTATVTAYHRRQFPGVRIVSDERALVGKPDADRSAALSSCQEQCQEWALELLVVHGPGLMRMRCNDECRPVAEPPASGSVVLEAKGVATIDADLSDHFRLYVSQATADVRAAAQAAAERSGGVIDIRPDALPPISRSVSLPKNGTTGVVDAHAQLGLGNVTATKYGLGLLFVVADGEGTVQVIATVNGQRLTTTRTLSGPSDGIEVRTPGRIIPSSVQVTTEGGARVLSVGAIILAHSTSDEEDAPPVRLPPSAAVRTITETLDGEWSTDTSAALASHLQACRTWKEGIESRVHGQYIALLACGMAERATTDNASGTLYRFSSNARFLHRLPRSVLALNHTVDGDPALTREEANAKLDAAVAALRTSLNENSAHRLVHVIAGERSVASSSDNAFIASEPFTVYLHDVGGVVTVEKEVRGIGDAHRRARRSLMENLRQEHGSNLVFVEAGTAGSVRDKNGVMTLQSRVRAFVATSAADKQTAGGAQ